MGVTGGNEVLDSLVWVDVASLVEMGDDDGDDDVRVEDVGSGKLDDETVEEVEVGSSSSSVTVVIITAVVGWTSMTDTVVGTVCV